MWLIVMHPMVLSARGPHAVLTYVSYTKSLAGGEDRNEKHSWQYFNRIYKNGEIFAVEATRVLDETTQMKSI